MNKEFVITSDRNAIFIKGLMNHTNQRIHILSIKDVMAYKIVINKDVNDLHTDYKYSEKDTFYKLVITSRNYDDNIELIYNEIENILSDESLILSEINRVNYKPLNYSLYDFDDDIESKRNRTEVNY